jgi:hypothetical protein
VLKTLSEQIREAGANLQPTVEFEEADELPDRFHVMKQRCVLSNAGGARRQRPQR